MGHGLLSVVLILFSQTLDSSFGEADAMPSSVSSNFLHLVHTISDTSRPQIAPSISSHKLWCQTRALLLSVPQAGKISSS